MAHVGSLLLVLELNDKFDLNSDIVRAVSFAESIMGYFEQTVFKYVSVELKVSREIDCFDSQNIHTDGK